MNDSFTAELPLTVRIGLARAWIYGVASEASLGSLPKDELPEQLWTINLISEDTADIGFDALMTLGSELAYSLVAEAAACALICPDCLAAAVLGWADREEGH